MTATEIRSKVLNGLMWSALQNWGARIVTLGLFVLIARLLSPHDFGVFASAMAVLSFVTIFVDQGLSEAIVQRKEITPQVLNSAFVINLGIAALIIAGLCFAAPTIASHMKVPELVAILRVGSAAILINALCFTQQAMHRRNFNYRWLAVRSFASTIISGLVAAGLALAGFGAWSLVIQMIVGCAINAGMLWMRTQWKFSFAFDFSGVRQLLSYGVNKLGTQILDFGATRYIEIFLASMLGTTALGVYLVGVKIYQTLMQSLSAAILDVAHSGFSRLTHEPAAILRAYYKAIALTAAVAVPVFVFVAALAPELTLVVFGPKWSESAAVCVPMAFLGAIQVLQFYNGTVCNAMGRPQLGLVLMVFKVVAAFSALWLARNESVSVIAWWYAASQVLSTPLSFLMARWMILFSLRTLAVKVGPFLIGAALSFAAIYYVRILLPDWIPLARLVALASVGGLVYMVAVLIFARRPFLELLEAVKDRRQATV